MLQGKKQETNTGGKAKMPDHYWCTITCAYCRKHYEDKGYHKQRLSAKLKTETGNVGQNGKCNSDKGKGKSKAQGKGQEQGKGGHGGPNKKTEKHQQKDRGNLSPPPGGGGGNPEPSGGQQNTGPTSRSQTLAQQAQGAKPGQENGDEADAQKASCLMWMA